jgi:hypothetical protein
MPGPSQVGSDIIAEWGAFNFGGAFHEAGEIVGHFFVADAPLRPLREVTKVLAAYTSSAKICQKC